jgi:16S rRNA processing protein RimM
MTRGSRILLGHISGAHGVRGDVLVQSYTERPEDIASYGPLLDDTGTRAFSLEVVRSTPRGIIARIPSVADRTAAEALKGTSLYVHRDRLPETPPEEFYVADLIGLAAVSPDGAAVGEVIAVQNYGAGDLLEIRLAGGQKTELIPFTAAFVPEVDVPGGRLAVVPPVATEDEEA